jgi:hypothetical protein
MSRTRFKLACLGLALMAFFAFSSTIFVSDVAAKGESQVRVGVLECTRIGGPVRFETRCVNGKLEGELEIIGFNQNNHQVSRTFGRGSIVTPLSVNDWWWDFGRIVKITYKKFGIKDGRYQLLGTYVAQVQDRYLVGCRWVNVAFRFNYLHALTPIPTSVEYQKACTSK